MRIRDEDIRSRRAWTRGDLAPADWLVPLPPRCVDELDAAVRRLRREPLPTVLLEPGQVYSQTTLYRFFHR